jgi:hypothetical protein
MSNRFDRRAGGGRFLSRQRLQGAAVGAAAGVLVISGVALASVAGPGKAAPIHGCVNNKSRALTVPKAGGKCPAGTTALSWNVTGPAGKAGRAGKQGAPGWGNVYGGGNYGFHGPVALAYDGAHLWVANYSGHSVTELNGSTGARVRTLSGGSYDFNLPHALAYDGTHLWVANYSSPSVTELPGA